MDIKYDDLDNNFATTLDGSITASDTVINLNQVPTHASKGYLTIDADDSALMEYIYFESKGAGFVTCPATGGRGQGGTTALAHDDGAIVKMYVLREHIKPLVDQIDGAVKTTDTDVSGNSWVVDEDDMASDSDEKVPTQQSVKAYVDNNATSDWNSQTDVIPTRASADDPTYVIQFAGVDLTSKVSVGQKISWVQNGSTRYGFITALSVSGGNTSLTLYGGTDYDVDNTSTHAISDVKFSSMKAPYGFPLDPDKWSVKTEITTNTTLSSPTNDTWINIGSYSLDVPIGVFELQYSVPLRGKDDTTHDYVQVWATLAKASATEDEKLLTSTERVNAEPGYFDYAIESMMERALLVSNTAKTTYYLNVKAIYNASEINLYGSNVNGIIKAIIAYL